MMDWLSSSAVMGFVPLKGEPEAEEAGLEGEEPSDESRDSGSFTWILTTHKLSHTYIPPMYPGRSCREVLQAPSKNAG